MKYRRCYAPGHSYFFTVNLSDRKQSLLTDHIDLLRYSVSQVKLRHPFSIDAIVVLPDHLHAIWTLPENDHDYSTRWRLIKSIFSRNLTYNDNLTQSRMYKKERGIWQRRFWEHLIRDQQDFDQHIEYIHFNPVKHGYTNAPTDWIYSSIHHDINPFKP